MPISDVLNFSIDFSRPALRGLSQHVKVTSLETSCAKYLLRPLPIPRKIVTIFKTQRTKYTSGGFFFFFLLWRPQMIVTKEGTFLHTNVVTQVNFSASSSLKP